MNITEHRVLNGLLKMGMPLETAINNLDRDVVVHVRPERITHTDLWPALWALIAVLERQFSGTIFVSSGSPLSAPGYLSERVRFGRPEPRQRHLTVAIGAIIDGAIYGDAGADGLSIDAATNVRGPATAITGFALAGYLAFACLGKAIGLSPNKAAFARRELTLRTELGQAPSSLTLIGLGQLGQSYLSLIYFLRESMGWSPELRLIDRDTFQVENRPTQILFEPGAIGNSKAEWLATKMHSLGFSARPSHEEINWGWKVPTSTAPVALIGVDNMPARRMVMASGFERLLVGGIGASFERPRVSWHDLPGDPDLARVFPDPTPDDFPWRADSDLRRQLEDTPGGCGWLTFQGTAAAAPSMGLVASAFVLAELFNGGGASIEGSATLWSQLLPYLRTPLR